MFFFTGSVIKHYLSEKVKDWLFILKINLQEGLIKITFMVNIGGLQTAGLQVNQNLGQRYILLETFMAGIFGISVFSTG